MDSGDLAIAALSVLLIFVGAALTIGIELARGQLERNQRRADQRADFQRQTLLELQEALYQLVRALSNAKQEYEHLKAGKPPIVWPILEDPRIIGAGAGARIILLTARVNDPQLRDLVRRYRDTHKEMFSVDERSDEESFSYLEALWELQEQANDRIGDLLRLA